MRRPQCTVNGIVNNTSPAITSAYVDAITVVQEHQRNFIEWFASHVTACVLH